MCEITENVNRYVPNFRRLITPFFKPDVSLKSTIYPFQNGVILLIILFVISTGLLGFVEIPSFRYVISMIAFVCMSLVVILSYMKWQNGIVTFMVLVFSVTIWDLAYGVFTPEEIILQYKSHLEQHM